VKPFAVIEVLAGIRW